MKFWLECLAFAAVIWLLQWTYIPVPFLEVWVKPFCLFLLAFGLGLRLPDIDLYTPGLVHRSILTHAVFIPLLLLLTGYKFVVSGLALSMSVHLLADSFPKAWTGGALVKVPLLGSIGKWSPWWLMINSVLCLILGIVMLPKVSEWFCIIAFAVTGIGSIWYMLKKEQSLESALVVVLVIGLLVWMRCESTIFSTVGTWFVKTLSW